MMGGALISVTGWFNAAPTVEPDPQFANCPQNVPNTNTALNTLSPQLGVLCAVSRRVRLAHLKECIATVFHWDKKNKSKPLLRTGKRRWNAYSVCLSMSNQG